MDTERKFYVYQYECPIRDEIIYIGKGSGYRAYEHLDKCRLKIITMFYGRLKWILKQNKKPIIKIIKDNITEKQAFNLEKKLIKDIGRKDLNKGTLLNQTDGGDGQSGYPQTKQKSLKLSKSWKNPNRRKQWKEFCKKYWTLKKRKEKSDLMKKIKSSLIGKKRSIQVCKNISIGTLKHALRGKNHPNFGKPITEEQRQKQRIAMLGRKDTLETRKKKSDAQKRRFNKINIR